jgi:hypothetical protein
MQCLEQQSCTNCPTKTRRLVLQKSNSAIEPNEPKNTADA